MRLSVVIPAYNEEKRLPKTLKEVDKYLSAQDYHYEIVVVNDGSKDKTAEVVRKEIVHIKNLRLINNKENKGKGYVVRQGLLEARGDYRLFTDADNSTPIDQIEKCWPEFEKGFDIVVGSRDVKGAVLDPPQPFLRRFLGDGFKIYRKLVADLWEIEDTQCGFKCFKKEAAENVLPLGRIDRFAFDPEILLIAKKLGYKIKEVPVYWKNDPQSKVKASSVIKMALDLIKLRINLLKNVYQKQ